MSTNWAVINIPSYFLIWPYYMAWDISLLSKSESNREPKRSGISYKGNNGYIQITYSVAIVSIILYSIIVRYTGIIHIINYSSLQVMTPRYYWQHGSCTSDWVFYIKNSCARRLFIPLLVQINTENSPFLEENGQNIQKLTNQKISK